MAHYGIYQAIVVSAADPMMQGRVQVKVPSVVGGSNAWARPCRPPGSAVTPRIGTSVWVMFEGGDASRPVWMGSLA